MTALGQRAAPGADPAHIRFGVQGADAVAIGAQGEVILHTAAGDLVQPMPAIYQQEGGRRRPIEGRWIQLARGAGAAPAGTADNADIADTAELGFAIGPYDRTRPLVIDPTLVYSTYLGGGLLQTLAQMAVDGAGNAYVTGTTISADFPGIGGSNLSGTEDAFVTKIDATGTAIVYSSYLGGDAESLGYAIAVDRAGSAYVTGITSAANFPGTSASAIQPALAGGRVVQRRLSPDRLVNLRRIGIDEFSYRKRHRYLTIVVDHDRRRVVWATEGRNAETLRAFFRELGPQTLSWSASTWQAATRRRLRSSCPQPRSSTIASTSNAWPATHSMRYDACWFARRRLPRKTTTRNPRRSRRPGGCCSRDGTGSTPKSEPGCTRSSAPTGRCTAAIC